MNFKLVSAIKTKKTLVALINGPKVLCEKTEYLPTLGNSLCSVSKLNTANMDFSQSIKSDIVKMADNY